MEVIYIVIGFIISSIGAFVTIKHKVLGTIVISLGVIAIVAVILHGYGVRFTVEKDTHKDSDPVIIDDTKKSPTETTTSVVDTTQNYKQVGNNTYELFNNGVSMGLIFIPSEAIEFSIFEQQHTIGKNTGIILCDLVDRHYVLDSLGKFIFDVVSHKNKLLFSATNGKLLANGVDKDWNWGAKAKYGRNINDMKSSKISYKWHPNLNSGWPSVKEWLDYGSLN